MKVRFIIKEQDENKPPMTTEMAKKEIQSKISNIDAVLLPQILQFINELEAGNQQPTEFGAIGEEKSKKNCFAEGAYKTFKGKSKCVQNTKGLSKEKADAYVASVLRDMGELPKKKTK